LACSPRTTEAWKLIHYFALGVRLAGGKPRLGNAGLLGWLS
jgi:hypothetical protein